MAFKNIVEKLDIINGISTSHSESWTSLTFEGVYCSRYSDSYFSELYDAFVNEGIVNAIVFHIDNERMDASEFIEELYDGSKWKIHINKTCWLDKFDETHICHTFFYYKNCFTEWVKESNPFEEDYPLNKGCYHIYVKELGENFGGSNLIVNGVDSVDESSLVESIPDFHVEKYIRINCNSDFVIAPHKQIISWGSVNSISKFFYRNAILVLLASLCDEIAKDGKIIIRGYKKVQTDIGGEIFIEENLLNYYNLLLGIYKWMYTKEDSYAIKKRLFAERISLDINQESTLYASLHPILADVYSQIKEQYSYIMYDRKDAYQKELKDLLKDIKNITDLFSSKTRSILANLLRDILAALVLIGITLFSKVSEVSALSENHLICYVFKAFGFYFWFSAILQTIFDYIDIKRSYMELDYWKNITRSYISTSKFNEYKSQTINKRFGQFLIYYIFIIILYISIGSFCFNYQLIWKKTLLPIEKEPIENADNIPLQIQDSINILIEEKNDTII